MESKVLSQWDLWRLVLSDGGFSYSELQALNQLSDVVDNVKSKVFSLKSLITTVVAGATVKESVGMVADLQDTVTQFEVLLGSADKAQKRVDELVDLQEIYRLPVKRFLPRQSNCRSLQAMHFLQVAICS